MGPQINGGTVAPDLGRLPKFLAFLHTILLNEADRLRLSKPVILPDLPKSTLRCSGILLAGGRSRRMGQDKAFVKFGGVFLLQHVLAVLSQAAAEVVVVRAPDQPLPELEVRPGTTLRVVRDSVSDQGPLQGLADGVQALKAAPEAVFVLSCDLPRLGPEWLHKLQQHLTGEWDVVGTETEGIPNPLLALYRLAVLQQAPELVRRGEQRPITLWSGFRTRLLRPQPSEALLVRDANTPEELEQRR
jgi:molybdopterin-guanine dinucleotide biosynthesis protein A